MPFRKNLFPYNLSNKICNLLYKIDTELAKLSAKLNFYLNMENFYIEGSEYIPEVDFNAETGILNITGNSYSNYTTEFFEPIFDWLNRYLSVGGRKIELNFNIAYFNTNSSKSLTSPFIR